MSLSYSYQVFLEQVMAERGPGHHIWEDNDKLHNRQLGELCGLRVPELLQGPCALRKMTPPQVPAVIKPVHGCSARGVIPLLPEGDRYWNLFTGERVTWEQATREALAAKHTARNKALVARGHPDAMRPPWLLEELILNPDGTLPCDWKGFVFGGRVEAVFQLVRTPGSKVKRIKWWGPGWEDLGDIMPTRAWTYDSSLPGPEDPRALTDAFQVVAGLVDSPFIRVDLYEQDGPVFGETTPHPTGGTVQFVPEWDERLGRAWADAA